MTHVVVVGAGVVGAAVAFRLAQSGARVTVLEAGRPGGATSLASFAWMNSNDKEPMAYHQLNTGGMAEHHRLREELGGAPWLHAHGNIEWKTHASAVQKLSEKVARLRSWGYQAEILTHAEVAALEPEFAPPADAPWFAFYPGEGYVDTPLLIGGLLRAARRHGATVRTQTPVAGFVRDGTRVTGAKTADGETVGADVVVLAAGHRTDTVGSLLGVRIPMAPSPGYLMISAASPVRLNATLHAPDVSVRHDGAGRIMMRSGEFDPQTWEGMPRSPMPAFWETVYARTIALLPALAGTSIETFRVGVRPIPADGFPIVGPVPGTPGAYVVCAHSGVTMAPLLGRLAAREIMAGDVDARLSPYRPERLITG
ncbi:MAG: FAD-binding oxidoreductase [Armatimonadetes bacterium]|nr:FAD-binding oxidoreductase [Armatimonadota bacterium]